MATPIRRSAPAALEGRAKARGDSLAELAVPVHAPGQACSDVRELADFIRRHHGVAAVLHDAPRGTIVIRYDERQGAAQFLRGALLDRLLALRGQPTADPRRLAVTVAHELPGRVRLRVEDAPPGALERLAAFVATLPGVERARASPKRRRWPGRPPRRPSAHRTSSG